MKKLFLILFLGLFLAPALQAQEFSVRGAGANKDGRKSNAVLVEAQVPFAKLHTKLSFGGGGLFLLNRKGYYKPDLDKNAVPYGGAFFDFYSYKKLTAKGFAGLARLTSGSYQPAYGADLSYKYGYGSVVFGYRRFGTIKYDSFRLGSGDSRKAIKVWSAGYSFRF